MDEQHEARVAMAIMRLEEHWKTLNEEGAAGGVLVHGDDLSPIRTWLETPPIRTRWSVWDDAPHETRRILRDLKGHSYPTVIAIEGGERMAGLGTDGAMELRKELQRAGDDRGGGRTLLVALAARIEEAHSPMSHGASVLWGSLTVIGLDG